jgi:hypothetical protein
LRDNNDAGDKQPEDTSTWDEEDDLPLTVLRNRWRTETKLDLIPPVHDITKNEPAVQRIVSTKRIGGLRHYLVKYEDNKTPVWISSSLLPAMLLEDYHARKTWKSKSKLAVEKLQMLAKNASTKLRNLSKTEANSEQVTG